MRWGRKKYGNQEVKSFCSYGYTHRSKLERSVCHLLSLIEKGGEIQHVKHEARVYLSPMRFCYIPDFQFLDLRTGQMIFIEAKGYESPTWKRNYRSWKIYGPGPLHIYKGTHLRPYLKEVVIPTGEVKADG